MQNISSESDHLTRLITIGLSKSAGKCYVTLAQMLDKTRTAKELAIQLTMPMASVYRGLQELEQKGFITMHPVYKHTLYKARPIWEALDEYANYQRCIAQPILESQHKTIA